MKTKVVEKAPGVVSKLLGRRIGSLHVTREEMELTTTELPVHCTGGGPGHGQVPTVSDTPTRQLCGVVSVEPLVAPRL